MKMMYDGDELKQILSEFKDLVVKEIVAKLPRESGMQEYKLLKNKDLKKQLSISDSTIENLRNSGALNYTKVLGTYYYYQTDVNQMLENNKTQFKK
jgi:hypothetical protein